jgi:hypothetical protein
MAGTGIMPPPVPCHQKVVADGLCADHLADAVEAEKGAL